MNFTIHHMAMHLVDAKASQPTLADKELDLNGSTENGEIVGDFIQLHLASIWNDATADLADVRQGSSVLDYWQQYRNGNLGFVEASRKIATLLHQVSPSNATRGLLLVISFSPAASEDRYLALLKLDPGDRDIVKLAESGSQLLLDLAVEHVHFALPDPTGVLKWALLPHPTIPSVGAKLKDRQVTDIEVAVYFEKFLDAGIRRRDHVAINRAVAAVGSYLTTARADKAALSRVEKKLAAGLEDEKPLTQSDVVSIVREVGGVEEVDEAAVKDALSKKDVDKIQLAVPTAVPDQIVTYKLDNQIKISGPSSVIHSQVDIDEVGNEVIFTVRAGNYTINRGR